HLVGDNAEPGSRHQQHYLQGLHGESSSSSLRVSAERSSFGMKPTALDWRNPPPKSRGSRLDTSTTFDRLSASRSATSSPLRSGSATSRRTTSGTSSRTSSTAASPLSVSPTTSYPSSSSRPLAEARKAGWSSTIRTL